MTDGLAPWANLGMLLVIGGVVTLVLVGVALTAPRAVGAPSSRRPIPQTLGAIGAVAAFVAGLAVSIVAILDPDDWWLDLAGWGVWIVGEILVFAVMAGLLAVGRRSARSRPPSHVVDP